MSETVHDTSTRPAPPGDENGLVAIRLPVWWTLGGLVAGLVAGMLLAGSAAADSVLSVTGPLGSLWLRALQMTIIPLVAALLVVGIARMAEAARAGPVARRMLLIIAAMLVLGGVIAVTVMPLLLSAFPIPPEAAALMAGGAAGAAGEVPGITDFITSLVAPNVIAAAAETATLPLTVFFALFALAVARLPAGQRAQMIGFFVALGNAMLILIGWVLFLAPVGVFALALGVAVEAGGGAFAAFAHYILVVSAVGVIVTLVGYLVAVLIGRHSLLGFARAMLPAQAVAISTQSSLASLPAMLASARRLGIRESTADFVLPLAVAIFRATSPAMNLAVALYVAALAGITPGPAQLAAGVAVAFIISIGSVSLPGTISFVISVGPIALAMGVPVEPLALLVAVEMLPDIVRTVGNVTQDVALATASDRAATDLHGENADSAATNGPLAH
ncbi:dicarboxylate/amino acid:cation symporter [Qipengyuania sp. YIM B01966]|uniref:dicarboxylate/amino acid:cation symporter n=1 Tax=Qipengyuania sp. YIM B01966 TaxID=2778646 RepID=UPI00351C0039